MDNRQTTATYNTQYYEKISANVNTNAPRVNTVNSTATSNYSNRLQANTNYNNNNINTNTNPVHQYLNNYTNYNMNNMSNTSIENANRNKY